MITTPYEFDFSQPIRIVVNGKTVQNSVIDKSLETLEKWNKIDNDRYMLFAAEVEIRVN